MLGDLPEPVGVGGAITASNMGLVIAVPAVGALAAEHNSCTYAFAGGGTQVFFASEGAGPTCRSFDGTLLAATPAPVGAGAAIATAPGLGGAPTDTIFALRGGSTPDFWRYTVAGHAWQVMTSAPANVGDGGCMVSVVEFRGDLTPLPVAARTWGATKRAFR